MLNINRDYFKHNFVSSTLRLFLYVECAVYNHFLALLLKCDCSFVLSAVLGGIRSSSADLSKYRLLCQAV